MRRPITKGNLKGLCWAFKTRYSVKLDQCIATLALPPLLRPIVKPKLHVHMQILYEAAGLQLHCHATVDLTCWQQSDMRYDNA